MQYPLSSSFLSFSALLPLVEVYCLDEISINMEAKLAKRTLEKKKRISIISVM